MNKATVVYGGQWGSEGKGVVMAHIARTSPSDNIIAVRVGGPNAGHTFYDVNGDVRVVQQIPTAAYVRPQEVTPIIGASGFVLPGILRKELNELLSVNPNAMLYIDNLAAVISSSHMVAERDLKKDIGSTGEGVGAATAAKVMREPSVVACNSDDPEWTRLLAEYAQHITLQDTVPLINDARDAHLLFEGTQGQGLSLNTGGYYPFCTSRECGPDALLSQCGTSPRAFDDVEVVAVYRTFPIRVGGNSGPLPGEVTWEKMEQITGRPMKPEITTVTKKIRRIARFDFEVARRSAMVGHPTTLAITFLDYLDENLLAPDLHTPDTDEVKVLQALSASPASSFLAEVERELDVQIGYISFGFSPHSVLTVG